MCGRWPTPWHRHRTTSRSTECNRQRLSDLLPNSVSAKPRIRAAYPPLRLRAQRRPPGAEFCGPETERREWLLNGWTPAGTKIREIDSRKSAPKRPLAKFKEIGGKNKIAFPTKHLRPANSIRRSNWRRDAAERATVRKVKWINHPAQKQKRLRILATLPRQMPA